MPAVPLERGDSGRDKRGGNSIEKLEAISESKFALFFAFSFFSEFS